MFKKDEDEDDKDAWFQAEGGKLPRLLVTAALRPAAHSSTGCSLTCARCGVLMWHCCTLPPCLCSQSGGRGDRKEDCGAPGGHAGVRSPAPAAPPAPAHASSSAAAHPLPPCASYSPPCARTRTHHPPAPALQAAEDAPAMSETGIAQLQRKLAALLDPEETVARALKRLGALSGAAKAKKRGPRLLRAA